MAKICSVLEVQRSGFCAWLKQPKNRREGKDERLLGKMKQFWIESGFAYGYRNIAKDLRETGESCSKNRVHRIMRTAAIRSQRGYKHHPGFKGGNASHVGRVKSNKLNTAVVGVTDDLASFMFGASRQSLSVAADIPRPLQHDRCFYCSGILPTCVGLI